MTSDQFRKLALSFPDAEERSHMNHPDFRMGGKIFATISPDPAFAMAKLTSEQQATFLKDHPAIFKPASGKWGEGGATMISLALVDTETAGAALTLAYENLSKKK